MRYQLPYGQSVEDAAQEMIKLAREHNVTYTCTFANYHNAELVVDPNTKDWKEAVDKFDKDVERLAIAKAKEKDERDRLRNRAVKDREYFVRLRVQAMQILEKGTFLPSKSYRFWHFVESLFGISGDYKKLMYVVGIKLQEFIEEGGYARNALSSIISEYDFIGLDAQSEQRLVDLLRKCWKYGDKL